MKKSVLLLCSVLLHWQHEAYAWVTIIHPVKVVARPPCGRRCDDVCIAARSNKIQLCADQRGVCGHEEKVLHHQEQSRLSSPSPLQYSTSSAKRSEHTSSLNIKNQHLAHQSQDSQPTRVIPQPIAPREVVRGSSSGKDVTTPLQLAKTNVRTATAVFCACLQIFTTMTFSPPLLTPSAMAAVAESLVSVQSTASADVGRPVLPITFNLADEAAAGVTAKSKDATAAPSGQFEEAWDFINRFALNRKFNGNDWQEVHIKFGKRIKNGEDEGKVTTEMVKLLNDKYSRLISPEFYASLSKYDLVGAGVLLSPDANGKLIVSAPPQGKAQASGIRKGDRVLAINGKSTLDMTSFDVITFLSEYKGTTITFTVQGMTDEGTLIGEPRSVELERTFQKVNNPVDAVIMTTSDGKHKVGYIKLREFNAIVGEKVKEAIADLTEKGADEFVLDLRGNGGGAFQSALAVAGVFMGDQPITSVIDGEGKSMGFKTQKGEAIETKPLLVFVNERSASASEVLAGALHDDCRALLVGTKSFGKGIIQAVYGLSDGSGLILTVARYETPRGTDIQGTGIAPDIETKDLPAMFLPEVFTPGYTINQAWFDQASSRQATCPPITDFKGAQTAGTAGPDF